MSELEMRNNELFNEISWLKQQLANSSMLPNSITHSDNFGSSIIRKSASQHPKSAPANSTSSVNMEMYKQLSEKLQLEQQNRLRKAEEDARRDLEMALHDQENVEVERNRKSQPLCRNLLDSKTIDDPSTSTLTDLPDKKATNSIVSSAFPKHTDSRALRRRLRRRNSASTLNGADVAPKQSTASLAEPNSGEESDDELADIDQLLGIEDEEVEIFAPDTKQNWRNADANKFETFDNKTKTKTSKPNSSHGSRNSYSNNTPFTHNHSQQQRRPQTGGSITSGKTGVRNSDDDFSDFTPTYLEELSDEEDVVDDILYNSLPNKHKTSRNALNSTSRNREKDSRVSSSTKSHDSGYLEERISNCNY